MKNFRIAFVHCWIMPGGALQVLQNLIDEELELNIFSESCIFTVFSDRKNLIFEDKTEIKIVTALPKIVNNFLLWFSWKNIPLLSSIFDYRNLMVVYPSLMRILSRKIRKYNSKNIIISSFAVAKNIDFCKKNSKFNTEKVKLYLHSPMQYIRSHYEEYLNKLSWLKKILFQKIVPGLRKWDKKFVKFDKVKVNSKYTAKLAKEIYGIESKISYPKISSVFINSHPNKYFSEYYLYIGRLTKLVKEVDIIIRLFNKIDAPLLIMWSGPDEEELKKLAGNSIMFIGWIEDEKERMEIMSKAKWIINLTKESFGLSNVESLLLWVPIFGYNEWATSEFIDKDSGILVDDKKMSTLVKMFGEFQKKEFDRILIAKNIREKL